MLRYPHIFAFLLLLHALLIFRSFLALAHKKSGHKKWGEVARLPLSETDISRRQVLTTLGSSAHQWKAPRPSQGNKQAITQLHRSINEVLLYFTVLTYFISVTSQAKAKEISE